MHEVSWLELSRLAAPIDPHILACSGPGHGKVSMPGDCLDGTGQASELAAGRRCFKEK